ncbi:unnamed protein product [Rotaria sp. Silwood1]|nr:unnamed protein product [Rotaria sp. Silwood1]
MGNSTVTPATSLTRINTTTSARRTSAFVINPDNFATSKKSPTSPVPWSSANEVVPVTSTAANISPTDKTSITFPNPVISVVSPTSAVSIDSPTLEIPLVSPTPSENDIPERAFNFNVVTSPDTSPVPPTINTPTAPIRYVSRPIAITPVNSIISPTEIHSTAFITTDASANPNIRVTSITPVTRTTPLPTKVVPKRTVSRTSTLTREQSIPITLSSAARSNKWNKFEQEKQDKQKQLFHVVQQAQNTDLFTSTWTDSDNNKKLASTPPHIVALPSFALRTTAVSKPSQDDHILLERTQSMHSNISIFKFYLDQKETKSSIGNHTKATMFKMNTLLKQTPFPSPSLSSFTKNFNDGTPETDTDSIDKPTFQSLGLQNDFEIERINQSAPKDYSNKKQQRNIFRTSSFSDLNSNSNNSFQFLSSTILNQPNYSLMNSIPTQNNHQPLTSISKIPSSYVINNPHSTEKYSKALQEFQKNDLDNYQSTVSVNVLPPTIKPGQSILKSEKLFSNW